MICSVLLLWGVWSLGLGWFYKYMMLDCTVPYLLWSSGTLRLRTLVDGCEEVFMLCLIMSQPKPLNFLRS